MDQDKFRQKNHEIIMHFLNTTVPNECNYADLLKATIAQLIMNTKSKLKQHFDKFGYNMWAGEVVEIYQQELRNCIIDLDKQKKSLTEGVTIQ